MSTETPVNRSVEEQHDTLFKLKVKDYEPPTPEIGKEFKGIRMTTFLLYTVSNLLFILSKIIVVTQYRYFMQRRTVGMICDHIFFFGLLSCHPNYI